MDFKILVHQVTKDTISEILETNEENPDVAPLYYLNWVSRPQPEREPRKSAADSLSWGDKGESLRRPKQL